MIGELVLASNNAGKLKEFAALLAPLGISVRPQADFDVPEADEPFASFIENAIAKARHAARCTGLPALADDSGLCVDVLGGAPGVRSARYAGEPKSDPRNIDRLLADLAGEADRDARFVCVLALVRHADDPQPIVAEGEWHGSILKEPRGDQGFGYDPLFWLEDLQQSAAELDPKLKNALSHRGAACRHLIERLQAEQGQP
ncbi:RdgB/HAM1 family non-canonical purine NTP pyrophosphatase [Nitrogeniibacter mangrovi]|uniref:dITP/XTP pyrophosphatase n=1 Tax=Nitrogeniibacter mangrovi TaxID=2016596 RepID=A0A6C1B262_9RHOO|nr:RdgB/HAM1 family non-canonical purine NTP pyrophosphatase [Nitrogeniibacter mangrovi]QID16440.1 RdgB/HAM1 family non-canonical purine NTP pyrophosphatase [Nitrogeniibacter mangrovi]